MNVNLNGLKNLKNLKCSDKSNKSMDLMKFTQSEDLSKDLLGNPRIAAQMGGFHDEIDE